MKKNLLLLFYFFLSASAFTQGVFINEINYTGTDAQQGVEIAGAGGTDLSGYDLYLYDNAGNTYHIENLNGTIPGATYDAIWFPIAEFSDGGNNGSGGLYLEDPSDSKVQFIGYGTLVAAINGPANGQIPDAVGVVQVLATNNPQLIGTGLTYTDFAWSVVSASTTNAVNTNQSFMVLPVELTSFTATYNDKEILLSWETASEENNSHFIIERSFDGLNFEMIGMIRGNGTTFLPQEYQFRDRDLITETMYYRLKQVDFGGGSEYSEMVSISTIGVHSPISIYPNPISNERLLFIEGLDLSEKGQLTIYNTLGKVMQSTALLDSNSVEMNRLGNGIYFFRIEIKGQVVKNGVLVVIN